MNIHNIMSNTLFKAVSVTVRSCHRQPVGDLTPIDDFTNTHCTTRVVVPLATLIDDFTSTHVVVLLSTSSAPIE